MKNKQRRDEAAMIFAVCAIVLGSFLLVSFVEQVLGALK